MKPKLIKNQSDGFITFIQEMNRKSAGQRPPASRSLLDAIAANGPSSMAELLKTSGLELDEFYEVVRQAKTAKLVFSSQEHGEEVLKLTDVGNRLIDGDPHSPD